MSHIGSNADSFEGLKDELDEGFDEEFEFCDNDELKDTTNNPSDIELHDKDLQRILLEESNTIPISNTPLLDDFDLGVFEAEQNFQTLDNSVNTPSSPYHQHTPSPSSVTTCEMSIMHPDNTVNENALYSISNSYVDFEPIHSFSTSNTVPAVHPGGASWYNPTLSSVNMSSDMMELNEASQMMTTSLSNFIPTPNPYMTTPTSPHTPMSVVSDRSLSSPGPSTSRVTRSLSPAPPSHPHNPPPTSPSHSGAYYIPSPAESSHSTGSMFSHLSFDNIAQMGDQEVVDMPFHKFKKVLDDNTVPDNEKERLKCIRRRGKNKVAAKNCRQKKLTMVCGLQQEVDQMRAAKARLDHKTRSLEQEIARWKQIYTHRFNSLNLR